MFQIKFPLKSYIKFYIFFVPVVPIPIKLMCITDFNLLFKYMSCVEGKCPILSELFSFVGPNCSQMRMNCWKEEIQFIIFLFSRSTFYFDFLNHPFFETCVCLYFSPRYAHLCFCLWNSLVVCDDWIQTFVIVVKCLISHMSSLITKFMGPILGPPGSCRPQMGPMLAPWTLGWGCCVGWCITWLTYQWVDARNM